VPSPPQSPPKKISVEEIAETFESAAENIAQIGKLSQETRRAHSSNKARRRSKINASPKRLYLYGGNTFAGSKQMSHANINTGNAAQISSFDYGFYYYLYYS